MSAQLQQSPPPLQRTIVRLQDAALEAQAEALNRTMAALMAIGGFTLVQRTLDAQRKRLARENRAAVDREGWIV